MIFMAVKTQRPSRFRDCGDKSIAPLRVRTVDLSVPLDDCSMELSWLVTAECSTESNSTATEFRERYRVLIQVLLLLSLRPQFTGTIELYDRILR